MAADSDRTSPATTRPSAVATVTCLVALADRPARVQDALGELGSVELGADGREVRADIAALAADAVALDAAKPVAVMEQVRPRAGLPGCFRRSRT